MDRRNFLEMTGAAGLLAPLAPAASWGQTVTASDIKGDMAILRGALALHPGLYRYSSPRQIEARLRALELALVAAPDLASRFLRLSQFLATIRCGHTHCNIYNQRRAVISALFDRPTRLPFRFAWIGRRMIVTGDESGTGQLVRGSEIVSVNGVPASHYLDRLLPYARADGHNDGKRVAQFAMHNTDTYETFDAFQGLVLPPAGLEHRLEIRTPDGRRRSLALPALTLAQRQALRTTPDTDSDDTPLWAWDMRGDVAVLTMPSWVMFHSKWDWEAWLDERLRSLSGARGLVIDLRDNEGGNECGNMILARLANRDLAFSGYEQRVRYRRTPAALDPWLDTWDDSFRTLGDQADDIGNGFYRLSRIEGSDLIPAVAPRITAPVAALIGPVCSSATFSFARRAKESGLVRLFGATSGGNWRGINGNGYFFVRLPASGLEFDIPLIGNFANAPRADAGVDPDISVVPTPRDIARGDDPCLDAALYYLRR